MRKTLAIVLIALATCGCKRDAAEDKVVMVSDDDPEMEAAMAKGRATIEEFWRVFEQPSGGEKDFSVKVPVTDPNGTEYFWLTELSRKEGKISGKIDNDPNIVKTVKAGQRIEVQPDAVVDWLYMRGGKMHGNHTVRPLLKSMDPVQAEQLRAIMADP